MKVFLLFLSLNLFFFETHAQVKLNINKKGELNETDRNKLMKSKGYQAISAFDTVSRSPLLIYAIYFKNAKMGILDVNGKEITPAKYDEIPGLNISHTNVMFGYHDHYPVVIDKTYGLITNTGKTLIPVKYKYITYGTAKTKEKKGMVQDSLFFLSDPSGEYQADLKGKITKQKESENYNIEVVEEDYNRYSSTYSSSTNTPKKTSDFGNIIKEFSVLNIVENKVGNKYLQGAYNKKTNELIIPVEYNYIVNDRYNRLIAYKTNEVSIKDSTGKNLLSESYQYIEEFNGLYKIKKDNKTAFFDKDLKQVSDFVYEYFGSANGEIIIVSKNGKNGIVNIQGKEITDFIFDEMQIYSSRSMSKTPFVVASILGKKGLLTPEGKYLTKIEYDDIYPESSISRGGGGSGDVMPDMYNYDPSNAYFIYKKENMFGVLDNNFSVMVPAQYQVINKSDNPDFVYVGNTINNKLSWGILNLKTNKLITPMEFNGNFKYGYKGYFTVNKNNKTGLYKDNGKLLIPVEEMPTVYIDYIYKGLIKVYNQKKIYYIDYYDEVLSAFKQ